MITITRLLARQIRTVFGRCLSPSSRGPFPAVTFQASNDGLWIRAKSHDGAIEFHQRGEFREERFAVPFETLRGCEGTIEPNDKAMRITSTTDSSIPATPQPQDRRTPVIMSNSNHANGNSPSNQDAAAEETGTLSLIEHAESVRDSLQEALSQTRGLITALKRQKKQSRIVESTLATLKRLQTVDV